MDYSTDYLQNFAYQQAQNNGIDPSFFLAQIGAESSWNPNAYNPAGPSGGAIGIAQFIQPTANAFGVNPYDPLSSIQGAATYDSDLLNNTCNGDYTCVAQHYGTLPNNLSNLNQGQQSVLSAAQNAGGGTFDLSNAACIAQSFMTLGLNDPTSCFGKQSASDQCESLDFVCKIKSSGLDLLSIIVGLILVTAGLFMLKSGSSAGDTIIAARDTVRGALADAVVA